MARLNKPWVVGIPKEEQPRYAVSDDCEYYDIFEDTNKWKFVNVKVSNKQSDVIDEELEMNQHVLECIASTMAQKIVIDGFGALPTTDPDYNGYYIVQFKSDPYTLQDDHQLDSGDFILKGELVVNLVYYNKVPNTTMWHTPSNIPTVVCLQQVIIPNNFSLKQAAHENELPRRLNSRIRLDAYQKQACNVSEQFHSEIMEEDSRRTVLDYIEEDDRNWSIEDEEEHNSDYEN